MAKKTAIKQPKELNIVFGAITDNLSIQLNQQGFKFKKDKIDTFQKLSNAVTMLKIHGMISETVSKNARDKIFKKIKAHVSECNPQLK